MNITIAQDANAKPEDLQVTVTQPSMETVFQGTVAQLKARIGAYDTQIANLQKQQAVDQAVFDKVTAQFTTEAIALPASLAVASNA